MFIGSNNSLTYLEPCCLWSKVLKYFGRCQNREYDIQYTFHGVRFFDIKLFVDNNNHIMIKNGAYKYTVFSFYEILDFFNKKGDVSVLITLDTPFGYESETRMEAIERRFIATCGIIESIYGNIKFYGGYTQETKEKLYRFAWETKNEMPPIVNPSEWSRLYRFVTKWCPWCIGKLNRKYIEKYDKEHGVLMLNYVNKH